LELVLAFFCHSGYFLPCCCPIYWNLLATYRGSVLSHNLKKRGLMKFYTRNNLWLLTCSLPRHFLLFFSIAGHKMSVLVVWQMDLTASLRHTVVHNKNTYTIYYLIILKYINT
jgi:hypothetical protein